MIEMVMQVSKVTRSLVAVASSALLVLSMFGLAGCGKAVAATVNGEKIYEADVTSRVEQIRTAYDCSDDTAWATLLNSYGYTPETLREETINVLAQDILVRAAAKDAGITVDSSTVDDYISSIRTSYGYTDDTTWNEYLDSIGYTADSLYSEIELQYLEEDLAEQSVTDEPDDAYIQQMANSYASSYAGKRSSNIVFTTDVYGDDAEAQCEAAIAELQASSDLASAFATKASEVNTDSTKSTGGDVGWDVLNSFESNYTTALDALDKGQMTTTPVQTSYGYHIILCTDVYTGTADADGVVDLTLMPSDIYTQFKSDVESYYKSSQSDTYVQGLVDDATIQINDMPSGLSYDVDMSLASSDSTSSSS
jgi:foldase protein PrsA